VCAGNAKYFELAESSLSLNDTFPPKTITTDELVIAEDNSASLSSPPPLSTNVMVHPVQCASCSEIQDSLQARHNRCYRCGEPLPEGASSPELLPTQLPKEK
jgi:hypothetical protein